MHYPGWRFPMPGRVRRTAAKAPDRATTGAAPQDRETKVSEDATADEVTAERQEFAEEPDPDEVVVNPQGDHGGNS